MGDGEAETGSLGISWQINRPFAFGRTEKGAVTAGTMIRYEQIVRDFLSSIGAHAQVPLEVLSTDTILEFKERWLSGGRSLRTVNQTIKILKKNCLVRITRKDRSSRNFSISLELENRDLACHSRD